MEVNRLISCPPTRPQLSNLPKITSKRVEPEPKERVSIMGPNSNRHLEP